MNKYAISLKQTLTSLIRERSSAPAPYILSAADFSPDENKPIYNLRWGPVCYPLCLLCAFFLACIKKRHRTFPYAALYFITGLAFELYLMNIAARSVSFLSSFDQRLENLQ